MKRWAIISGAVAGIVAAIATSGVIALASRNSGGTYSLPAGNPVVSGTTISSSWANTTLSDIQTELTNSLDRNGRGPMLAPLQLSNGTVSLPSLTFGSDTDTGFYRVGTNDLGATAGGTKVADFVTTGATMPLGLIVTQSQTNTTGITSTGNGTGQGILSTGGASSGAGGAGTGGAPNGDGYRGQGTGSGSGIVGYGGATSGAAGGFFSGGSTDGIGLTTAGVGNGNAIQIGLGNAKWTASNPAVTTGFTNTVAASNVPKAWAYITTDGAGSATLQDGFNVASVSLTGAAPKTLTVTFATAMASAVYAVSATLIGTQSTTPYARPGTLLAGSFILSARNPESASVVGFEANALTVTVIVFGKQ